MRYLLSPSDAAALEQLERGDSTAYLDALTAAVEAGSSASLPEPGEAEPTASPHGPAETEPPASAPDLINFHG